MGMTLGKVWLDGIELHGVRGVSAKSEYNAVAEVTITMIAGVTGDIDGALVSLLDGEPE